ncbi:ABC transporter [Spirochaetia bacterium]|nr:ABC transporter [Spirochaetia bacterium]
MVVKVLHASKFYRSVRVLDDVSLELKEGDYFGFLGENGSGKSTLVAILLGLIPPDKGTSVELFGAPVTGNRGRILRRRIGVVGEASQLNDDRSVWSYMDFFARLYDLKNRAESVAARLEDVGLFEAREKKIRTLSRGMKQRLALGRALLHDPELLILDEPINGLDPKGIHDIRELLERENRRGKTIFLCSHLLSEVERSCTRIAIIHKGKLLICGNTADVAEGDLERAYLRFTVEAGAGHEG